MNPTLIYNLNDSLLNWLDLTIYLADDLSDSTVSEYDNKYL